MSNLRQDSSRLTAACCAIVCAAVIAVAALSCASQRAGEPCQGIAYCAQTRHRVWEPFCAHFQNAGGIASLGSPLTSAFTHSGLVVQYFEKARMEYHSENPARYRIQLGLLGEKLGRWEAPIPQSRVPPAFDPSQRYYPQTGHTLAPPFLDYYDSHGGLWRFGYPLGQPYHERGVLVQDFQRARLAWEDGEMGIDNWGITLQAQRELVEDLQRESHRDSGAVDDETRAR